jgi:serine/threonine-protein kinase RsbW
MSSEPGNTLERCFHNRLDELNRAIEEALRFLQERNVGDRAVYVANLAIEEMVTNTLKYGYDDTSVHELRLRMELHPGELLLVFEDDGHEFNPLKTPEPELNLPTEQRVPGGLGIYLVHKLVERMDYERCGGRNRLSVRVKL